MTIVCAMVYEGRVWMAADSMSTDDEYEARTQNPMVKPKIMHVGDALIGLAGQHVLHTLFHHHKPPAPTSAQTTVMWVQKKLLPWVQEKLDELEPRKRRFNMLVARGGELFQAEVEQNDLVQLEVAAIGSGSSYALGALTALKDVKILNGQDRVRQATAAACVHDPYCGGRIDVASTQEETTDP